MSKPHIIRELESRVLDTGDVMTGLLTLSGTPTSNLHAATKQYVDNSVPSLVPSATSLETARTLITNLSSTTSNSFDGTKDIELGIKGVLSVNYGGTGATTAADALLMLQGRGMQNGDFNQHQNPGIYWMQLASCTNTPMGRTTGYGQLKVERAATSEIYQFFTDLYSAETFFRSYANGAWNSWFQIDGLNSVKQIASTDNAIARYDGTTGQIQNSGVTIDDSNNLAGVYRLKSNSSTTTTNLSTIPSANAIALETGDGGGSKSVWIWRENWSAANYGLFHDNSNDTVHFVGAGASKTSINLANGALTATNVYGAVWNDYAEYRNYKDSTEMPYGRVVIENGDDSLSLSTERLQKGGNIVSDTFGFAIGETDDCKLPIAVSGRALVYTNEDRYSYGPGDAVCTGPNGTISKMTEEEIRNYPDRIIGYVSAIPEYETWGTGNVEVNGRIWIKVI